MQVSSINSAADARRLFAAGTAAGTTAGGAPASAQPSPQQIQAAARQFEAIILRQLLTPAIDPLMSHGIGGTKPAGASGGGGVYGYLVTDVLANSLSQGGGLGLARMLEKQLTPKGAVSAAQAAATYRAGDLKP
jgi:peptidoglycan hydrolase FlgJ